MTAPPPTSTPTTDGKRAARAQARVAAREAEISRVLEGRESVRAATTAAAAKRLGVSPDQVRATIGPNSEPQRAFLANPAQIRLGGGAAGGGKTYVSLLDPLRYIYPRPGKQRLDRFSGVLFRRTTPQITNEGGPWDESTKVYGPLPGATPVPGIHEWRFAPGANGTDRPTIRMTHMQHAANVLNWQGSQIPWVDFEEATHFDRSQVIYFISRLRNDLGIVSQMLMTCNPDPDWWGLDLFVRWYIDEREELPGAGSRPNPRWGLPRKSRANRVRYFFADGDNWHWADTPDELKKYTPNPTPGGVHWRTLIKSFAFIPFKASDNVDLMRNNPEYMANLLMQSAVDRARLLEGNWFMRSTPGAVFPETRLRIIEASPWDVTHRVRFWDKAGTEGTGDWTAGVLLAWTASGRWIIEDVVRGQFGTAEREAVIKSTALMDGKDVAIRYEQEPGSGGKDSAYLTTTMLAGWDAAPARPKGKLPERARALSAQWQAGNVAALAGKGWLSELKREFNAAYNEQVHDDQISATAGAFNAILNGEGELASRSRLVRPDAWPTIGGGFTAGSGR